MISAASSNALENVRELVSRYGGDPESAYALDCETVETLAYATLISRRSDDELSALSGIYEWQGAPLVVFVERSKVRDADQLHYLMRCVALRGDAPYLGIVEPGRLEIVRVRLSQKTPAPISGSELPEDPAFLLPFLANTRPAEEASTKKIADVVLKLLDQSISALMSCNLPGEAAISLAGRALFARFLADRDLPISDDPTLDPADAFSSADRAEQTSKWLDRTFNGDFLPLPEGVFKTLPAQGYQALGNMMHRADEGQLFLGWKERWDNLHFAHIPVGVLSQAYEAYLRKYEKTQQKKEGSFYTPAPIVELIVRATLEGIDPARRPFARVFDPSAGAGIFLITALKHLVAARWRHDGVRPSTQTLHRILYRQIAGADINEEALRFAALGLYLATIELDADPQPLTKHHFENLRGRVLFKPEAAEDSPWRGLGSLGPGLGDAHHARYDVVLGNPPWSSGTKNPSWQWIASLGIEIAEKRGAGTLATNLFPNECLDLPFVWRAMEWAKPNGQIAFALDARVLFQQGDGMPDARSALFRALDVTSVINGADLRKTRVWPQITHPFCIIFSRNRQPSADAQFRFLSPRIEPGLNRAGLMRIDPANAVLVSGRAFIDRPHQLKTLFRGTELDADIKKKILRAANTTMKDLFSPVLVGDKLEPRSGTGFQTLKPSSRPRRPFREFVGPLLPGQDAQRYQGMPMLEAQHQHVGHEIDVGQLPKFTYKRLHDPRSEAIFRAPLVIVTESARVRSSGLFATTAKNDVAYSESYYGYSVRGMRNSPSVIRLVTLILMSDVAHWWFLISSGKFGVEREVVDKRDVDSLPLPDLQEVIASDEREISRWFATLNENEVSDDVQDKINAWVAGLYRLSSEDYQIIRETIRANSPVAPSRLASSDCQEQFRKSLVAALYPWAQRFEWTLRCTLEKPTGLPWRFIRLDRNVEKDGGREIASKIKELPGLLSAADTSGASEIYFRESSNTLWIGLLDQPYSWTHSRAVLCSRRIIFDHTEFLTGTISGVPAI